MKETAEIVALVTDLFFATRIREAGSALGVIVKIVTSWPALRERCQSRKPVLIIVDLNATQAQPIETIAQIKTDAGLKSVPVVSYLPHVRTDWEKAARDAGSDLILPRSKFSVQLPDLIKHYARA